MTSTPKAENEVIVSGMQPSGRLHIGNYLGAARTWLQLQEQGRECFFFIADYHSISGEYTADEKRAQVLNLALDLLALGIDPKKSTLFVQSHVPEHTELAWVFNTVTPVSFCERMTQFKDKAGDQAANVNMGLFDYPVLQAADILMYKGTHVPVGVDQVQHVELTRDVARFFNNKFGAYFPETKPLLSETPKVRSLTEPFRKMSKSHGDKACIYLTDGPDEILEKMKRAVTETTGMVTISEAEVSNHIADHAVLHAEDEKMKGMAGVWNLLLLLRTFGSPAEAEQVLAHQPIKYGDLKKLVAERIADHFAAFRARRVELAADPDAVAVLLDVGATRAREIAAKTMADVRTRIGVR